MYEGKIIPALVRVFIIDGGMHSVLSSLSDCVSAGGYEQEMEWNLCKRLDRRRNYQSNAAGGRNNTAESRKNESIKTKNWTKNQKANTTQKRR